VSGDTPPQSARDYLTELVGFFPTVDSFDAHDREVALQADTPDLAQLRLISEIHAREIRNTLGKVGVDIHSKLATDPVRGHDPSDSQTIRSRLRRWIDSVVVTH
jgi:hypothetical protein